ncbi:MAG: O-antigen ligase family protein [Rhodobacter sp.]|nr:O-antigen ligase family protein [Rhodobacter sp.]
MTSQIHDITPKQKGRRVASVVFFSIIFCSVGRISPEFIPIEVGGLVANQVILVLLFIVATVLLLLGKRFESISTPFFFLVLCLCAWASLSSVWSLAPTTALTKSFSYFLVLTSAAYVAQHLSVAEIMSVGFWATLTIVLLSAVLAIALPDSAGSTLFHDGAWRGLFMQKNVLARAAFLLAAFAMVLLFSKDGKHRITCYLALILAVFITIRSQSVTAFIGIIAMFVVLPVMLKFLSLSRQWRYLFFAVIIGILSIFWLDMLLLLPELAIMLDRDPSLTGRVPLLDFALYHMRLSPVLGYGLEGFFSEYYAEPFFSMYGWAPEHAHNGLIDLALELGAVGLSLFLMVFGLFFIRIPASAERLSVISVAMCACVFVIFAQNVTESNLFRPTNMIWILFLVLGLRSYVEEPIIGVRVVSRHG